MSMPSRPPHQSQSNVNCNVRILVQGHCVVIISLFLLYMWLWTRCNGQILVNQARNWIIWMILLLFTFSYYFWVKLLSCGQYKLKIKGEAFIRHKVLIWEWASIKWAIFLQASCMTALEVQKCCVNNLCTCLVSRPYWAEHRKCFSFSTWLQCICYRLKLNSR